MRGTSAPGGRWREERARLLLSLSTTSHLPIASLRNSGARAQPPPPHTSLKNQSFARRHLARTHPITETASHSASLRTPAIPARAPTTRSEQRGSCLTRLRWTTTATTSCPRRGRHHQKKQQQQRQERPPPCAEGRQSDGDDEEKRQWRRRRRWRGGRAAARPAAAQRRGCGKSQRRRKRRRHAHAGAAPRAPRRVPRGLGAAQDRGWAAARVSLD